MIDSEVKRAVELLRRGGIILYPTDTVWGIGCDATLPEAVAKIYALKGSVNKKGMIVLLDSPDRLLRYIKSVPDVAWDLFDMAEKPLTLILPGGQNVAPNLIPDEGTLAIRIPHHDFCRDVVAALGHPLVSTSANFSGEPTPLCFDDIADGIVRGVDLVVDRSEEGNPTGQASSIMMIGEGGVFKIIR